MIQQKNEFLTNYIINGVSVMKDELILKKFDEIQYEPIINVSDSPFKITYTNSQKDFLNFFANYVYTEYVSPFRPANIVSANLWDGVDKKSLEWHVDNGYGQDCSFLYYLDDCLHDGYLEFKNEKEEFTIHPTSGTLVWLNQSDKYKHRASRSRTRRRIINVEFKYQTTN